MEGSKWRARDFGHTTSLIVANKNGKVGDTSIGIVGGEEEWLLGLGRGMAVRTQQR